MLLSGSLVPALRTGALVGTIELREAQSALRQQQPSAVREPWSASAGVSRAGLALDHSPTSARAPSNGPQGGELAIAVTSESHSGADTSIGPASPFPVPRSGGASTAPRTTRGRRASRPAGVSALRRARAIREVGAGIGLGGGVSPK